MCLAGAAAVTLGGHFLTPQVFLWVPKLPGASKCVWQGLQAGTKQAGTTADMQQNGGRPLSRAAEWRSPVFPKKCSSILLHICGGCRPPGHQAGGNHCLYAAEWKSPDFMKKCSSILLHICSG